MSKQKFGYTLIVAATVFLYRTWLLYVSPETDNAKIIIFLSISAILCITGLVLVIFSKKNSDEYQTNKTKKIVLIFAISLLTGVAGFLYKTQTKAPEKIDTTKQNVTQIISQAPIFPFKLITVVSVKKAKFNVPENLDNPYAYFGEGLPHQGWQADALVQTPDGAKKKFKIFLSKDNRILHTIPFDLIRILKSEPAVRKAPKNQT